MGYDVETTAEFDDWLGEQAVTMQRIVAKRILRISDGLLGDVKSVGGGVSEVRIDVGPGYRVYYTMRGRVLVILLCGGTKRTQSRDIAKARLLASEL